MARKQWTEEEIQFLKDNIKTMSYAEMAEHLGRTVGSVKNKADKTKIFKGRFWTDEEVAFLEDNVGLKTFTFIAEKLGRTVPAVHNKACELGIGRPLEAAGLLSLNEITKALDVTHDVVYRWMEKHDFPAMKKNLSRRRTSSHKIYRYVIDPEKFWKWAEKHKDLVNFARIEEDVILPEPRWVIAERAKDAQEIPKRTSQLWTDYEIKKLQEYDKWNWSYEQIGEALGRTPKSCWQKLRRMKAAVKS